MVSFPKKSGTLRVILCKGSFFGAVSGADEMIVNYASLVRTLGHEPSVLVSCAYPRDDPHAVRLRERQVPVRAFHRHPLYVFLRILRLAARLLPKVAFLDRFRNWEDLLFWTIVTELRRAKPDLVHVIAEGGLFIRAARAAGVPVLYQEPAMPWYSERPEVQVSYEKLAQALPQASTLVAVSPEIARLCREKLPCPGAVRVLPIVISDPGKRLSMVPVPEDVRFGFAARLEHLKGPEVLIEAFAEVLATMPTARLFIAGTGEDEGRIKARANALGLGQRCQFVGVYTRPADRDRFFDGLDVLVHPSLAEGTPCTIIEALARGVPVIASAVGGIVDMLPPSTGLLVPPGDARALAIAMRRLAGDAPLRRLLAETSRRRYEELFSPQAVAPLLLSYYRQLAFGVEVQDPPSHPWSKVAF